MSLFPAYIDSEANNEGSASTEWLENESFTVSKNQVADTQKQSDNINSELLEDSASESLESYGSSKKKKKRRKKEKAKESAQISKIEFDGSEEFYVDKMPAQQYKTIDTLHKPACPRYRTHFNGKLGLEHWWQRGEEPAKSSKRYFHKSNAIAKEIISNALSENDYTEQLGVLNRKTMESPSELQPWMDVIKLQERNPYKWSRLLLAEKKLDLIQRALAYHAQSEELNREFISIINCTYPSFEVSKLLDTMLAKDPHNYLLWTAQIMATQGTMARCVVPDVLRIYDRCMQKMHHAQQKSLNKDDKFDDIMLRLFHNCALFLRQAGLYEHFFALMKLALHLNVLSGDIMDMEPQESDEQTLIEYEELILQSGLPMNEIWLRIEKLRQSFHFLPCAINKKVNDPQRIVFNEDICHYIYPLKTREKSFFLMLQILHLLKVPIIQCEGLSLKFSARVESIGDSDAIEDILAVCVRRSFALSQKRHEEFLSSIYQLAKEMAVTPTFISNSIGHEIYTKSITQLLMNCATSYAGIDERKRMVFLLLWCRFEIMLIVMQKCSKNLNSEYVKAGRSRFKSLLKQRANQNILNLYTEFAIYEYEALQLSDNIDGVKKIFENLIVVNASDENLSSDICFTYATYVEILIERGYPDEALLILASYALSRDIKDKTTLSSSQKLMALQKMSEKLERVIAIEQNVEIMVLEQYLLPDYTVSLLKMRILLQYLVGQKMEALSYLDKMLKIFRKGNDRHTFLRENIHELYIMLMQLPSYNCHVTCGVYAARIFEVLQEFPRNLFLLQQCCMLKSTPWCKVRKAILGPNPTVLSVTFLIALARYRFMQQMATPTLASEELVNWDKKFNEIIVRNRILNIFQTLTTPSADGQQKYNILQRNGLFWRLYLRCISDQNTSFEVSKRCLLTALDECPWNKSLYLDGATYVPQELCHLQDLIIEKQLRIYALPEELEILRER